MSDLRQDGRVEIVGHRAFTENPNDQERTAILTEGDEVRESHRRPGILENLEYKSALLIFSSLVKDS
jgi:hypothetical protein